MHSARVAYINVESQLKLRGIPFSYVDAWEGSPLTPEMSHIQSSLARSVPALCVQSEHILSGAPAAEAAMPNIRVIPLNWWCAKKQQVRVKRFASLGSSLISFVGLGRHLRQVEVCPAAGGQEGCERQCYHSALGEYYL